MRLQFEHGEITLYGWIPVKMKLHGLFQKEQLGRLKELLINFSVEHHNNRQPDDRKVRGRFSEIIFDNHVTIEYGNISEKENRYQQMLTAMLADQAKWIEDHKHVRVIDADNAVQSLKTAGEANQMAQNFNN